MRSVKEVRELLDRERLFHRKLFAERRSADLCAAFPGRVAVVLSGGGARGAYEAGALLAFQDAGLRTHIITAASIGSVNAASYAAHSATLVGNAEPLVESWLRLTSPAVGIEWTRYMFVLGGFLAAMTGLGNLFSDWLGRQGIVLIHLHRPGLTWSFLALAGASVLFLHDRMPYLGRVLADLLRDGRCKPDVRKLALSLFANLVVCSFLWIVVSPAHLHLSFGNLILRHPRLAAAASAAVLASWLAWRRIRSQVSLLSHLLLRLPLRSGLFPNDERTRFLREHIPTESLRRSPIRVVMATTDLRKGSERFFTNASQAELSAEPGANAAFVAAEMEPAKDLIQALLASSALPLVYEAVSMNGGLYTDGGIVVNQPVRPAVNLGADVLFLVVPHALDDKEATIHTFLDLGLRSIEIMMAHNLRTDSRILVAMNGLCERFAAELGVRPEQVLIDLGNRSYRYLKLFTLRPSAPLGLGKLDFDGRGLGPAIVQGYADGCKSVLAFLEYAVQAPISAPRRVVSLSASGLLAS
ncbi:MAG: patatin-like phospholipase family protein [Elusimicrobiota bacterium]|nr:MAG: patatin-like phospholipase family protein [Elusimicrobiota bacterium]